MKLKQSVLKYGFLLLTALLFLQIGCGPDYPKCETDDHCIDSEQGQSEDRLYCVNGLCQQCRTDESCGDPSLECNAGVCEQIIGYCASVSDCPGNQKCRDNRCGSECLSNDECSGDQICDGGNCVAKPECSSNGDCADGQNCDNGQCVAAPVATCQLETVYFDYDASAIKSNERNTLNANAQCIKDENLSVEVVGNADERGTTEYNIALGERRANSVKAYLKRLGVNSNSVDTISYGDQRLVRQCGEQGAESCHQQNRRVEFNVR
ncbi:OmpA family protein [Bradymonas sediminis]|nr:OmpA family protein [Bradymonas sediminis]TDP64397.1 peptidoglycan-associated lipoprotein [Bradymonas sediminis]